MQKLLSPFPSSTIRAPRAPRTRLSTVMVRAEAGILQRLGRVLKEKTQRDLERLKQGMSKSSQKMGIVEELLTFWRLDDAESALEELEEALIMSDFGPKTSLKIVDQIRPDILSGKLKSGPEIKAALKKAIVELLQKGGSSELNLTGDRPSVILIVGVNGGGKTTTIGKLAAKFRKEGAGVMLAPGDTFRAAAAEQLAEWANRTGALMGPVPKREEPQPGKENKVPRPDAVLYQTIEKAIADESIDLVICDTAGRLQTNFNLMEELKKCRRSIEKKIPAGPNEVLLVLDGTTGLNMLSQAKEFNEAVQVTGLILTKLDGTAKGGAVLSVVDQLGVPVKFIGVGEGVDDLQPFDAPSFVDALLP